jgi:hypothetical protein
MMAAQATKNPPEHRSGGFFFREAPNYFSFTSL